ncbi:MAG: TrkA family potassium uptake protein [Acholeplasma sp.]|nr:TrkA family potassium uptake protein [Acholeplasma sp.]
MKKTIAIIGMGRFGLSLVESFSRTDIEIIAIDNKVERVEKAGTYTPHTFVCDSTREEALKETGIKNVDHVIVAMGQNEDFNISTTIITVIKLKKLGVNKITVRLDDDTFVETMHLLGADDIIFPLKVASDKLANRLSSDSVIDYFKMTDDFDAYEIELRSDFDDMPIIELNARSKYFINILVIKRAGDFIIPNKDSVLKALDHLFIFGRKKDIGKIISFFDNNH